MTEDKNLAIVDNREIQNIMDCFYLQQKTTI